MMNKIKSFSLFTMTNFLYSFSQWIILIIILKFIDVETMGVYSLGIAISAPIVLITTFGSNVLLITNKEFTFSNYFYNKLVVQGIFYLILILIIITIFKKDTYTIAIILLVILFKFTSSFIDLFFIENIANKLHNKVAIYKITLAMGYIIINFSIIYFLESIIIATLLSINLNLIFIIVLVKRSINNMKLDRTEMKKLMSLGVPISTTLFLSSLNTNVPKYALEIFTNSYYVGVFTSLLFFYSVGNQMFFSINNFILPYIREYKNEQKLMQKLFIKIMFIPILFYIPLVMLFYIFIDYIVISLFSAELLIYKKEMIIIIIASGFIYYSILFDIFINLFQRYKFNTLVQITSVLIVTLCSLLFIKSLGILGATITFSIYCITVFILKFIYSYVIIFRSK
ncbi:lipopolysaccharide biosynthesis protein [Nosocomiicoccus ampullae]|uniref:lipopolysaccharide biosynthesis protein n=1 Tax=Nosocomiicoccus ampullae TaxID=489910 RepID=UPI00255135AC|nr:hypothetical protein [Nosocomiicoccus ampullae]